MTEKRVVPSYPTFKVTESGDIYGPSGVKLNHFPNPRGYRRVNIYLGGKRWKQVFLHVLVCEAFHGPRPEGCMVAHRDGNKDNNAASNLGWVTQWQNEHDKRVHGTALLGERHHQAKLTENDVYAIRARLDSGERGSVLAREYGLSQTTISHIRKRHTWAHLPEVKP